MYIGVGHEPDLVVVLAPMSHLGSWGFHQGMVGLLCYVHRDIFHAHKV